jgi:hypothetical protein
MSFTFDPASKTIVVNTGVTSISAIDLYSRWKEWFISNSQYLPVFRVVGGDPVGGGIFVSSYFFLINGWRIRPYEGSHTLTITGNISVDGGGDPTVPTLGSYNVIVKYVVPERAQGISVSGTSGPSASDIAIAVKELLLTDPSLALESTAQKAAKQASLAVALSA